jgi:hypothetical protein
LLPYDCFQLVEKIRGVFSANELGQRFLVALIFLVLWFSQSVVPFRISGAVDYAGWEVPNTTLKVIDLAGI